jgi:hypothetical protein
MDLFATLLDAVGLPVPGNVHAVSLLPLARGEPGPPACDAALSEYLCFGKQIDLKSLRTPRYKLLLSAATGGSMLFDVAADPKEKWDLTAKEPKVVEALAQQIQRNLASSLDGYHLTVLSGTKPSVVRARFVGFTPFRDVELSHPERGDGFRFSKDRLTLDVKFRVQPVKKPARSPDVDGIKFHTTDDKLAVVTRLEVDGAVPPFGMLTVGNGQPYRVTLPWRFIANPPNVVRYPLAPAPALDGAPRVQLSYVRRGAAPTAEVSQEVRDRLEALGYVP